jgi:TolB-like protein/Tfp pilus assembly protein PilF
MSLKRGSRLGPYEIVHLLGSGGMAEVYRARDVRLDRDVALKIIPEDFASDPEALARFEREARTASALNHPHLVTIYDIGEGQADGGPCRYIAMELIHGDTFRHRMLHGTRDELLRQLADIAEGLAKAHDAGVVHRDLKPENVMVSDDDFAKVVDFGLAKHVPKAGGGGSERLTSEGFCVGTLGYMAPEQVRGGQDIDGRADIFAFGCMLYEVIAKENPFDGQTVVDSMHRILHHEPPPLADAAIERIARRCLAKQRDDRYATMREVATDVRKAIGAPVRRPIRRRRWLWTAAAAITLAAGGSAGLMTLRAARAPAIESIAVLPFRNATGNTQLRFLGDGVADELVRSLGRIQSLRVIASSSASRFRDTSDPQKAARELGVSAVLTGHLRTAGQTVLLQAELLRGEDGTVLWGKRYTHKLENLVTLEQEIAGDLCDEVRIKLAAQHTRAPRPEAYEAYLRGKTEAAKETAAGLNAGIQYFDRAIELDPDYAVPYSALALVYGRKAVLGIVPTQDGVMQQAGLAQKALSLDETLPEAHWNLALAAALLGNDAEFERRLARVLELNPNFAPAWIERAVRLVRARKFDEAEAAYQKARSLDPLSPRVMTTYGLHLGIMREYDRGLAVLRSAIAQFPDYANAWPYLGMVNSLAGRHAEAVAAIDRTPPDLNANRLTWQGIIYARAGRRSEARAIADQVDEMAKTRYLMPTFRAQLRAQLGDRDAAFALIEQGIAEHDWRLTQYIAFDPGFDVLRGDPRFVALLKRRSSPGVSANAGP